MIEALTLVLHLGFLIIPAHLTCPRVGYFDFPNGIASFLDANITEENWREGAAISISCNAGFFMTGGSPLSLCKSIGWSPPLDTMGTCEPLFADDGTTCPANSVIRNVGRLMFSQNPGASGYARGTVMSLLCIDADGYELEEEELVGEPRSFCLNGQWSPPLGICINPSDIITTTSSIIITTTTSSNSSSGTCPQHSNVANGKLLYLPTAPYVQGTIVALVCNVGYILRGTSSATCEKTGNTLAWSALGECISVYGSSSSAQCDELTVSNGLVTYDLLLPRQKGTQANLICLLGYVAVGKTAVTCRENGTLKWDDGGLGFCESVFTSVGDGQCGDLSVSNGNVIYDLLNARKEGTFATIFCNLGYMLQGSALSKCKNEGGQMTWASPGKCKSILSNDADDKCPTISTIANGMITYDLLRPRAQNTLVSLVCNVGYYPTGNVIAICNDGGWSASLGQCRSLFG